MFLFIINGLSSLLISSKFSRIEAGKLDARFIETEIAKLTLDLASSFESMAKSLNLDYVLDIPDQKILDNQLEKKVFVDRDMYEKMVFNLCECKKNIPDILKKIFFFLIYIYIYIFEN